MGQVQRDRLPQIPFKIEPVAPLDPVFPFAEQQGVHLACVQVRQRVAHDLEPVRLHHQQALFGGEAGRRFGIHLELDLQDSLSANLHAEYRGTLLHEGGDDCGVGRILARYYSNFESESGELVRHLRQGTAPG